jgi:hypothetical protein
MSLWRGPDVTKDGYFIVHLNRSAVLLPPAPGQHPAAGGRLADHSDALATVLKGFGTLESLSSAERAQFNCIFLAFISHSQNAFHQWRQGHLAYELWACWEALLMNMVHTVGGKAFWRERSYVFARDFRDEVDAIAAREPHRDARAFGVLPLTPLHPSQAGV